MKDKKPKRTLIVAGGGTGGHVLAGIAVADEWRNLHGEGAEVVFVGSRGGIEERLVPQAGYPLELLSLGALNRVGVLRRLKTLVQLPFSFLKTFSLIARYRPFAVVGIGGYASGPMVLATSLWSRVFRRPFSALIEQNSVPGMTNRILGRFVRRIFCAFEISDASFPVSKLEVTGNPIRSAMAPLPSAPREPFVVFAFGGSQGAVGMNTLILDALPYLKGEFGRLRFIHQAGQRDYERVKKAHEETGSPARVEKFIYEMKEAYAEASLIICRAGSSTLSELAAVRRAAILVPLPTAADNHQEKNARIYSDSGAAILFTQNDHTGKDLADLILKLMRDPEPIREMETQVGEHYRPNAARRIAEALERAEQG